ncbi:MAG: carbohydrate kinase [Bacteroidales bacterium]|nr:carbohydrate kinase [Bacteroidales bacterium]MBN2764592.1 carbohydrate kinase [Bacteroidales bacterium]
MRKIYAIGETVLDIIFKNNQPFAAKAGGACLNSSVTLGRLNIPVSFIGEYGLDEVGNLIDKFLKENNVSTQYVYRYYDGKSSLALAFLNENNDASYDFYKFYPQRRLDISFPEIQPDDIVMFGSIYAVTPEVREKLLGFVKQARKKKAIVIYDPNFRKSHLNDLPKLKPLILENLSLANIVRGSNEDFSFILGVNNAEEVYEQISEKTPNLLYTANIKGVWLYTPFLHKQFPVHTIQPISTIGAGDNFNAGIAYSIYKLGIRHSDIDRLDENVWTDIIRTAVDFATQVCLSYDNYISFEFAENYKASVK